MSKYIHNISQSEITYQGIPINVGEFFKIPRHLELEYATNEQLASDIVNSVVAISRDGINDLSPELGVVFLQSEGNLFLNTETANASSPVTTSSSSPVTIGGMRLQPTSGTYLAFFSGGIYTDGASAKGEFGLYKNGVLIPNTRRDISCSLSLLGGLVTVSVNAIGVGTNTNSQVELNGTDVIEVKFRSTNGGTIGFIERNLILMKVKNE